MPGPAPVGVALLDKPPGISSFAALSQLKRSCGTRKVGHTGTLDPFASGLLIGLVGKATRTARLFDGLEKTYHARVVFGSETNTDDVDGEVTRTADLPTRDSLEAVLPRFRGQITQTPPAFSAVHINGQRAYELARRGEDVEIPERTVTIHRLEMTSATTENSKVAAAEFSVACSTGTYIRSLARNIAEAAGSAGHVNALRRVSIGPLLESEATAPEQMEIGSLLPLESVLARLDSVKVVPVDAVIAGSVVHGQKLGPNALPPGWSDRPWTVLVHDQKAIAVGHADGTRFVYDAVLGSP